MKNENIIRFKSKIGLEFLLPVCVIMTCLLYVMIVDNNYLGITIISLTFLFALQMLLLTYYVINLDTKLLTIKAGFFYNKTIDIERIISVIPSKDGTNGPASSIDRLAIKYSIDKEILVSPKDKANFIQTLLKLNPNIRIKK